MQTKIWVIVGIDGEYSDRNEVPLGWCDDEVTALLVVADQRGIKASAFAGKPIASMLDEARRIILEHRDYQMNYEVHAVDKLERP